MCESAVKQLELFKAGIKKYFNLKEASIWASKYLNRNVSSSNISYLVQYGRISKYGNNGKLLIKIEELKEYYDSYDKESKLKNTLGNDLNWHLSFIEYKESERTKHVHRLHPYKGKFIPQLVEYFLDSHTDEFKKTVFFNKGDIILDPFCGSGTTLIQSNELGMHAVGIDISAFNTMISNYKVKKHDIEKIQKTIDEITYKFIEFQRTNNNLVFEDNLLSELSTFNNEYFPSPEYKRKINKKEINEKEYGNEKENIFLNKYFKLVSKFKIQILQDRKNKFLDNWFLYPVRKEIDFLLNEIIKIPNKEVRRIIAIILSRTVRSCRATTHADLATLKEPVIQPYYCKKHGKICKPLFTVYNWWKRYTEDTIKRLISFDKLRTNTYQKCLTGDSRNIDIINVTEKKHPEFGKLLKNKKIAGIFSSPPYVGLINYHEQHAYAYDLFQFERNDKLEIGPLYKGQGAQARDSYIIGISEVLMNCKKYLIKDYNIFLVANDKYNLYPKIAELSNMKIINKYKRPVLNRVEKDRNAYAEIIFHMKEK